MDESGNKDDKAGSNEEPKNISGSKTNVAEATDGDIPIVGAEVELGGTKEDGNGGVGSMVADSQDSIRMFHMACEEDDWR